MALVIELFLIGIGLSMDAFAVSICKGLVMEKVNKKQAFIIGLGLALCRTIANAHGGSISVRDNVPHGCVFCLRLQKENKPDVQTGGAVS